VRVAIASPDDFLFKVWHSQSYKYRWAYCVNDFTNNNNSNNNNNIP